MKIRILQVFFGADGLPYKDQARTVHYPITGNGFQNANNTTQIRFYFSQLSGENTTWVAVSKLPNGKIGSKVLETFIDDELNEPYALLELDSYYTQYKGDVFISLQGYQGGVNVTYDEETEIYEISGTPTIASTGSIKFTNNYAPSFVGSGQEQNITIQQLLGYLSSKADIGNTIYIVADIEDEDLSGYEDGQIIYDLFNELYYEVNSQVADGYELANGNGLLGNKGALVRFLDLTDSITLQEIYNMLGYMRYGVLNVDGLDYLVTMNNNNHIVAYDLYNKQLFDYEAAPEDTFYDVIYAQPIKFVQHTYSANKLYGTNESAQDTTLSYGTNVISNGIPQRESTGQIRVPTTPTQSYHATSKSYVDSNYGKKVQLTIDNDTFVLTVKLLNNFDTIISQASIDLPLESIVVSAQYYDTYTYEGTTYTKVLVIELATTDDPIIVPVGDLVSGLVSETTFNNAVAQLQTNINGCVKKRTTSGVFVYGHVSNTESEFALSGNATPDTIPTRDSNGNINVGITPSSNRSATSKQYVDTFGRTLEFSIDNTTYVMTFRLKDNNGNVISTQNIDLPLETMVVDGYYDSENKNLVLELKNGQTISIPISDLISGLVTDASLATTLTNYYTKAQIDQMVAGFVFADVDDYLSDSSTNPVENRIITNALDTKANTQDLLDGQLVPSKALTAQQIENVSEESGVVQETPFISQGTSTNNNTEETPTAPVAKQLEKQGNSVVVNQLLSLFTDSFTSNGVTFSFSNNKVFTSGIATETLNANINTKIVHALSGHKYLIYGITGGSSSTYGIRLNTYGALFYDISIWTPNSSGDTNVQLHIESGIDMSGKTFTPLVIDLTQWFGSNDAIPQDLLDHPEHWSWYDNTDSDFNAGSLDNSSGRYLVCTGRQQWDEEWEVGTINQSTGQNQESSTQIRSKNYIKVIPNTTYYFYIGAGYSNLSYLYISFYDANKNHIETVSNSTRATFVTPSNCCYIRFRTLNSYGTTYNNDITISVYYTTGDGYDQYYPYVQPKVYDTGVETLRKAGSVKDYKTPDGTIHRLVGSVDLSTLSFNYSPTYQSWTSTSLSTLIKAQTDNDTVANITSQNYERKTLNQVADGSQGIGIASSGTMFVNNGSSTTQPTGTLFYEIATPTTEQGTPFPENIEVDDYGTMYWLDDNEELVSIPQGTKLFYPADYVLLMDDLNKYVNGNVNDLALKTDLANDKQELSTVDSQLKEALGGTLRQLLATSQSVDFDDTTFVDLGELSWSLYTAGSTNTYDMYLTNGLDTLAKALSKCVCTKFRTRVQGETVVPDCIFIGAGSGRLNVYIRKNTYASINDFIVAMKNVLLAYEKAS